MLRFISIILISLMITLTIACDESTESTKVNRNKPLVGMFLFRGNDDYVESVKRVVVEDLGDSVDLQIFNANDNQMEQISQFDAFLKQKPNLTILNLVDPKEAAPFITKSKQFGLPIIFFNREPDPDVIASYEKAIFVGTTPSEAGVLQGTILADIWNKNPQFDINQDNIVQYVMLSGELDNPEAVARTQYSIFHARELGLDLQQVGGTYVCNWAYDCAKDSINQAFISEPVIEAVIANNDAMALGAIAALNEHGYNLGTKDSKFIPVIGVDASTTALEAIKNGKMSASVKQDSKGMADVIVKTTLNGIAGKNLLDGTDYILDSKQAVRLPYSIEQ